MSDLAPAIAPPWPLAPGVVPAYRGASTIVELTERTSRVLANTNSEMILVVDGSPDEYWRFVEALARKHPHVVGVDLFGNFGQHNALLSGIRLAATFETTGGAA
jgi:glycosyltransferase involved in cell wall biosynthesis